MATLWFKDNALLIENNALSIADSCCCGLGAFYDCGDWQGKNNLRAIDITSDTPLTLSERTFSGYISMPLELGVLFTSSIGDKYFVYGVAADWKTAYARYYNGSTWADVSSGLPSGVTYPLQHLMRGTFSTAKGIMLLNGLHEKKQSGFPAIIFTDTVAYVAGAAVGSTTYFNVWNGTSWTATTHNFSAYGYSRYHVEQVADYYKPNHWAMSVIFEAGLPRMHYIYNGSLVAVNPPGFGTNAWRVNARVPIALDDTYIYTLAYNTITFVNMIYKYNVITNVWTLVESVPGNPIRIRGMTANSSGQWYGIGGIAGSTKYQSYLFKNSITNAVLLPNTDPTVSPESIYTVGKYVVMPVNKPPYGHHIYNTQTDTLVQVTGSG